MEDRVIDVWWIDDATSRLMLLFSYLVTRHEEWSRARIRLLAPANLGNQEKAIESLEGMLAEVRIDADPQIIEEADADKIAEISGDSSLVFMPARIQKNQVMDMFGNPMGGTLFLLPVTVMVLAAKDIELDAEPESGEAGETAAMLDVLEEAKKRARETALEAEAAAQAFEAAKKKRGSMAGKPLEKKLRKQSVWRRKWKRPQFMHLRRPARQRSRRRPRPWRPRPWGYFLRKRNQRRPHEASIDKGGWPASGDSTNTGLRVQGRFIMRIADLMAPWLTGDDYSVRLHITAPGHRTNRAFVFRHFATISCRA